MIEARCIVCGNPMGDLMSHIANRKSKGMETECCSEECAKIYYQNEDETEQAETEHEKDD